MTETMNGPSNGGKYIDSIDPDDPEYVKEMRRPAEVKEDIKQMETRKRVDVILQSSQFREELEQLVHEQMKAGPHPSSLLALQQISELLLPNYRFNQSASSSVFSKSAGSTIPIADIRGCDSLNYGKGEKILRCKLASSYRLVDLFGWSTGINSHITARINQENEHFLINPYGMLYHEITASSLLKVNQQAEIVDPGTTSLGVNKSSFSVHGAIHAARPDVRAIIHLQNPSASAVSSLKCGFLPLTKEAILCGTVSSYDGYHGAIADADESDRIARALGPANKVLVLRHHGMLVCGESVEEAFYNAGNVMTACETQLKMIPVGVDNLHLPSEEEQRKVYEIANSAGGEGDGSKRKWRRGEMQFEALMRSLDNHGYRTGYIYHEPVLRQDRRRMDRANSEVEIPPSATSFADNWDADGMSPMKMYQMQHKKAFKSEWLNTPNAYKREEIEETGTPNPKKITKWVAEGATNKSSANTSIKVETPNQFAPQGANPKELRSKHKEIRKDYYEERVSAGPQSRILEGMSWEEAQKLKDGQISGNTDGVIVVGAASKGIIQRPHQHNATVYKTYYAPNPFDNVSEDDVVNYQREMERKARGESAGDTTEEEGLVPGPDGRLISTEERMHHVRGDDVQQNEPPSPTSPQDFQRSASARYTPQKSNQLVQELNQNFNRSKSERKPSKNKKGQVETEINGAGSPTKSMSSGDDRGTSSQEGSPTKEMPPSQESPSKGDKKKKKFRMPSFSKTKKDKK